jgi:hypothetical protein
MMGGRLGAEVVILASQRRVARAGSRLGNPPPVPTAHAVAREHQGGMASRALDYHRLATCPLPSRAAVSARLV